VLRYPDAVRPWQHVLDPLHGYLLLAEQLLEDPTEGPDALNLGPPADAGCTVAQLVDRIQSALGGTQGWRVGPAPELPEARVLRLSSRLATKTLGWRPCLDLDAAVAWTAEWHLVQEQGADVGAVSRRQLSDYEQQLAG
jgi:CDP-glucose 4,6-dehydratase